MIESKRVDVADQLREGLEFLIREGMTDSIVLGINVEGVTEKTGDFFLAAESALRDGLFREWDYEVCQEGEYLDYLLVQPKEPYVMEITR